MQMTRDVDIFGSNSRRWWKNRSIDRCILIRQKQYKSRFHVNTYFVTRDLTLYVTNLPLTACFYRRRVESTSRGQLNAPDLHISRRNTYISILEYDCNGVKSTRYRVCINGELEKVKRYKLIAFFLRRRTTHALVVTTFGSFSIGKFSDSRSNHAKLDQDRSAWLAI